MDNGVRRNQILGGSGLKGNEIYLEAGERRRGGEREKTARIIERMLARLRREIEMLSPSRAYRRRGQRAKAIKRVRNVESFAESKVAECETTRCTKRTRTNVHEHTPKKKTTAVAVACYLVSHFSIKLREQTAHESILKLCHVFKNRPLFGFFQV